MDPYKVLGVSRDAGEKEIKDAYSKLAKKYHPDLNPGDKVAEQKMKEINAAYDMIKNANTTGTYNNTEYSNTGYNPFEAFYGRYANQGSSSSEESNELRAALNYINTRHYKEALNALSGVNEYARGAKWYYLSAYANYGLRNTVTALEHAKKAVELEPDNVEYRMLLNNLQGGGFTYNTARNSGGYYTSTNCNPLLMILYLFLMRLFCRCFCWM